MNKPTRHTKSDDDIKPEEAQRRFETLVRAALNTRPKPLKSMGPKGMPSQSKKKKRKKAKKAA